MSLSKFVQKLPMLTNSNWSEWELLMKANIGAPNWTYLTTPKPVLDNTLLTGLLDANGNPTQASADYTNRVTRHAEKWEKKQLKLHPRLVLATAECNHAQTIALEHANSSAFTLFNALQTRFKDASSETRTYHIGIFNKLECLNHEKRSDFIERLSRYVIILTSIGVDVTEEMKVERLLNGLAAKKAYESESHTMSLLPDQTWAGLTAKLRLFERREENKTNEVAAAAIMANLASADVVCYKCKKLGHKADACSSKNESSDQFRNKGGGRGNGKGGKFRHNGGRGNGGKKGGGKKGGGSSYYNKEPCNICGIKGHFAKDCRRAAEFQSFLKKRKAENQGQRNSNNSDILENGFMMCNTLIDTSPHTGCLDSGATSHLLKEAVINKDTKIDNSRNTRVQTAGSESSIEALGRADIGILRRSLIAPSEDLITNLVSVPELDKMGYTITFKGGMATVSKNETVIMNAPLSRNNLYQFDIRLLTEHQDEIAMLGSANIIVDLDVIHDRLGHRSKRSIRHAIKHKLIVGYNPKILERRTKGKNNICGPCAMAKATKYPKQRRNHRSGVMAVSKQEVDSFDSCEHSDSEMDIDEEGNDWSPSISNSDCIQSREHSVVGSARDVATAIPISKIIRRASTDTKGPVSVTGLKGERYYQGFIDTDTKYLDQYVFQTKNQCIENLKHYINVKLKSEGISLSTYQADGAGELISRDIVTFLNMNSCRLIYTPPYTPELNAHIERNHRTVWESAFAMLIASSLPILFWTFAILYAGLLYNHFPTTTYKGYMSPVEAKYGLVPDVSRFKKFGCLCWMTIPEQTRAKSGFVNKAHRCYFLGIDCTTQSYIVWIIDLSETKITSDVIFDEYNITAVKPRSDILKIAEETKEIKDFEYLIGMVYRDDETRMLYITTRIEVQKGFIVAYRCAYINDSITKEEHNPIHVADVVKLVEEYISFNTPMVVEKGKTSATLLSTTSQSSSVSNINRVAGTKRVSDPLSTGDESSKRVKQTNITASDIISPANGVYAQEEQSNAVQQHTNTHSESVTGQSLPTTSRRSPRLAVTIGKAQDILNLVMFTYEQEEYALHMCDMYEALNEQGYYMDTGKSNSTKTKLDEKWLAPDLDEIFSLVVEHNVWDILQAPSDINELDTKWVRVEKSSGRLKSRLTGRGFNMVHGVDYHETFAPVAKMVTLRIFLTIVAIYSLHACSLDVKTAFLNAPIKENVWLKPPKELSFLLETLLLRIKDHKQRHRIKLQIMELKRGGKLKLNKALYGTKQAGREWYLMIDTFLKSQKFTPNIADPCFYSFVDGEHYVLILLYVDDIIIAATTEELQKKYARILSEKFKVSYNGVLSEYLNISILHDRESRSIFMSQEKYIVAICRQFNIPTNEDVDTPMQQNLHLDMEEEENATKSQLIFAKHFPYRQLIGALIYLNVCTRPSISFAVSFLAKFNSSPTFLSCKALIRLTQYVYNTRSERLRLGGDAEKPYCVTYSDSDWGGDRITRKSRSGHVVFLGNGPVSWYSKMQSITAQSTMEAEYIAFVPAIQSTIYVRQIINCVKIPRVWFKYASTLWGDNESAITVSKNPIHHQRSKHIHMKYSYTRDNVTLGTVVPCFVRSAKNCSDIMTKSTSSAIFKIHNPTVMGYNEIPRSDELVETKEEEYIPCQFCSRIPPVRK